MITTSERRTTGTSNAYGRVTDDVTASGAVFAVNAPVPVRTMNDVLMMLTEDLESLRALLQRLAASDVDRDRRIELVAAVEDRWFAHVDEEEAALRSFAAAGGSSAAAAARLRRAHAAVERILDRFGALAPEERDWLPLLALLRGQLEEHVAVEAAELCRTISGASARSSDPAALSCGGEG
jgi:hypothetical protein